MDTLLNIATPIYVLSIPFALVVAIRDDMAKRKRRFITVRDLVTWLCVAFMPILNTFIAGLTISQMLEKLVIWENKE